jgi:hypothetical protein
MRNASPLVYWSLQIPHIILGVLIILLLARLLLAAMRANGNILARFLAAITSPVTVAVGAITPRMIPPAGVFACAIVWLLAVRVILTMVAGAFGMRLWG